jgi:hypothetical protein
MAFSNSFAILSQWLSETQADKQPFRNIPAYAVTLLNFQKESWSVSTIVLDFGTRNIVAFAQ